MYQLFKLGGIWVYTLWDTQVSGTCFGGYPGIYSVGYPGIRYILWGVPGRSRLSLSLSHETAGGASVLEIVSEIDGDRFFDKIGRKKPMSIFLAIFEKRGDLDTRFSRNSADFLYGYVSDFGGPNYI